MPLPPPFPGLNIRLESPLPHELIYGYQQKKTRLPERPQSYYYGDQREPRPSQLPRSYYYELEGPSGPAFLPRRSLPPQRPRGEHSKLPFVPPPDPPVRWDTRPGSTPPRKYRTRVTNRFEQLYPQAPFFYGAARRDIDNEEETECEERRSSPSRKWKQPEPTPHRGYKRVKSLKEGGMSQSIYVVKHIGTGKLRIEKNVSIAGKGVRKRTKSELETLLLIDRRCPNLNYMVSYLWMERQGHCSFLLEHCDAGSLDDMLQVKKRRHEQFSERFLLHVMSGLGHALAFLHYGMQTPESSSAVPVHGWDMVCHLDIKPQNIFLSTRSNHPRYCRVVLGDFGCAISSNEVREGKKQWGLQEFGTPAWYPPEGSEKTAGRGRTHYGPQTDIWTVGATIHSLCRRIWLPERTTLIRTGDTAITGGGFTWGLNNLIGQCCYLNYHNRINAHTLVHKVKRLRDSRR